MEVKLTCPLGSTCEEIKDNQIHRCRWYKELKGKDQSGDDISSFDCAIAWMPELQVEANHASRSVQLAVESFRNETKEANELTKKLMLGKG